MNRSLCLSAVTQRLEKALVAILDLGFGTAEDRVLGSGGKCACDIDLIAMGMPATGTAEVGASVEEPG